MASSPNIIWIDNLKGFAILAVVIGHIASPLTRFIYSWHIPLFFFISGLLFNKSQVSLKKDFIKLILPFIIFSLIGLMAEYLKQFIWPGFAFANGNINLQKEIIGIFWLMDITNLHHYGYVLWFLPALFWAKQIYTFLQRYFHNPYLISAFSLILLLVFSNQPLLLPFGIDKGLMGLFWFSLATFITGKFWMFSLFILLFLPFPVTNLATKSISVFGIIYSLIAINTFVGIFKKYIHKLSFLQIFGRQSLLVFITHPYLNNLAYFLIIYLLRSNWLLELTVILTMLLLELKLYEAHTTHSL